MRNTKEIALLQIRRGKESELPKSLHEGELGLAKDTNRVFVGNANNSELMNREEFPYQNLELLTEYSNLDNFLKYSYKNDIQNVGDEIDRISYQEKQPIVITGSSAPFISETTILTLNSGLATAEFSIHQGASISELISAINSYSDKTGIIATRFMNSEALTLISTGTYLSVESNPMDISNLGLPTSTIAYENLPEFNMSKKLDNLFLVSDYGIKGDGITDSTVELYKMFISLYKRGSDSQFMRKARFQSGTYLIGGSSEISTIILPSNVYIEGEGIDRTIIEVNEESQSTLFNISEFSDEKVKNVYIKDITIDASSSSLDDISIIQSTDCDTLLFENVKIIGNGTCSGIELSETTKNVKFINCEFENLGNGIISNDSLENIEIINSIFKDVVGNAIKLTGTTRACLIDGNKFINCATSASEVININGETSEYCQIVNSIFDKDVIERTDGYALPISKNYHASDRNFTDTLDITTDSKKYLRFHFSQPQWEYVTFLTDDNGRMIISTNGADAELKITADEDGNLTLETRDNANILLGYTENEPTGKIIFYKDIELNNHIIGNEIGDIIFKPASIENSTTGKDGVLTIDNSDCSTNYENRINDNPDNIPNVAYVNKIGNTTIQKVITYKNAEEFVDGLLPLYTFDESIDGDNIHIKSVSINVRRPFYPLISEREEFIDNYKKGVYNDVYKYGLKYYEGDMITDGTVISYKESIVPNIAVVKTEHVASTNLFANTDSDLLTTAVYSDASSDLRYADVFVKNSDTEYISLTRNNDIDGNKFTANIQQCDNKGLNPVVISYDTSAVAHDYFQSKGRLYKITGSSNEFTNESYKDTDHHLTSDAERICKEGYNYQYTHDTECYVAYDLFASEFVSNKEYFKDDIVIYNGNMYKCISESYKSPDLYTTNISMIDDTTWYPNTEYDVHDVVSDGNEYTYYECIVAHTSSNDFEDDVDDGYWELKNTIIYWEKLDSSFVDSSVLNANGKTLYLGLFDKNNELLCPTISNNPINPGGKMVVTIEFTRNQY